MRVCMCACMCVVIMCHPRISPMLSLLTSEQLASPVKSTHLLEQVHNPPLQSVEREGEVRLKDRIEEGESGL